MVSWNRGSWVRGEHDATTTRLILFSWITSFILSWVSWEQVNRLSSTCTTWGRLRAYSLTAGTSATPPILMPQLHTNTPTRGSCSETSSSGGSCRVRVKVPRAAGQITGRRRGSRRGLHHRLGDIFGTLEDTADIDSFAVCGHGRQIFGLGEFVAVSVRHPWFWPVVWSARWAPGQRRAPPCQRSLQ